MEHALQVAGFEGRQLVARTRMFGRPEILDNGIAATVLAQSRRRRDFALRPGNGRETTATVHTTFFGQLSAVTVDGRDVEIPHVGDMTFLLLMLPLCLLEMSGGVVGIAIGLVGTLFISIVCMGNRSPAAKVAICIGICVGAWILHSMVALVLYHSMMASL